MKLDTSLFRPKLLDCLSGYDRATLVRDVGAGVTVGVVALPLAMAFAIASGLKPGQKVVVAGVHVLSPGQKVTLYKSAGDVK